MPPLADTNTASAEMTSQIGGKRLGISNYRGAGEQIEVESSNEFVSTKLGVTRVTHRQSRELGTESDPGRSMEQASTADAKSNKTLKYHGGVRCGQPNDVEALPAARYA
jgi:hypothetical protein